MVDGRTHLGGMILAKTEAEWQMPVRRKTPESGGIKVRAVKRPPASGTCYEDEGRNSLRCPQTSVSTQEALSSVQIVQAGLSCDKRGRDEGQ